jgi:hypothetical protein
MQQETIDPTGSELSPPEQSSGVGPRRKRRPPQDIQRQLDEALADSFPASDPVSIVTSQAEEDWIDDPDETANRVG